MVQENSRLPEFRARLAEVHSTLRQLRIEAFVDYAPIVCGERLRPITLATYTTLLAWRNPFVTGGAIDFKAILQFVWLHHPDFGQFIHAERRAVASRVQRALRPRWPTFNAIARFFAPFPRFRWLSKFCRPTTTALHEDAVAEIRRLLHEALHDFPVPDDDAGPALYALQAQFVSLFTRGYALPFCEARALVDELPLKQLVEFVREILHRLSGGKEKLLTAEEARVWVDYLDYRNPES